MRPLAAAAVVLLAMPAIASADTYALQPDANAQLGCFEGCACPVKIFEPLVGGFTLEPADGAPTSSVFIVRDVSWTRTDGHVFTGGGTYTRLVTQDGLHQRLELELSENGAEPVHYDSGIVPATALFPAIDVAIADNEFFCFNSVFEVVAGPIDDRAEDVDHDGTVGIGDLVAVILAWGTDNPDADIDGNGVVGVGDLVAVVLAWAPA